MIRGNTSLRNDWPAHWRAFDNVALRCFDWRYEGVDVPYVFLITGRCGSTHLANLLTKSRTCGEPSEYFNSAWMPNFPEARMANSLGEYILYLVRARSGNRRFGFKIDHWRWKMLRSLVDVERLLPVVRSAFFVLTREDIVAQAHSFAIARATNIWHEYGDATSLKPEDYTPTDHEILQEMAVIARSETGFSRYLKGSGRSAMRLTYEQLIQDPESLLRRVGEGLALEPIWLDRLAAAVAPRVQKQRDARHKKQIDGFRSRFVQELAFLDTYRENFDSKPFNRLVLELRGIDLGTWVNRE